MNSLFPNGWLAFELGVLRRLKFSTVALPFTGEPGLCVELKQWKVRVAANDPFLWSFVKAMAFVENSSERLRREEIDDLLEDAYVPRDRLDNPTLLKWFNETDAWWFDTIRFNSERLESPYRRATALAVGMMVGDYVLSFNDQTRLLREPLSLSKIFRRLVDLAPFPFDNEVRNKAFNLDARSFLAERSHTDLLFLRLPAPPVAGAQFGHDPISTWREEWLRGGDDFWSEYESRSSGKLGSRVQSKQQYLGFVEDLLRTAAHIPQWAIAYNENGFISNEELVEAIGRIRKVETIYSKDFSDLLGVRASIITAIS